MKKPNKEFEKRFISDCIEAKKEIDAGKTTNFSIYKTKYRFETIKIGSSRIYKHKDFTENQIKCAIQNRERRYGEKYSYRCLVSGFKVRRIN